MTDVQNLISQNIVFTKNQQAEVTAACKLQIFDGRQIEFDNDAIKADVVPYLKKYKESNGLNSFFEETTNRARYKAISKLVGRQASYAKTFVRRAVHDTLSEFHLSLILVQDSAVALLACKCLGASENASPKHTIWYAIILPTKDDQDDEDEEPSTVPVKRSRNGNRKKATGDKEYLEDFWVEVGALFKEKNKSWGSDLKAPGWAHFIDVSIAEERCLHPEDSLPLIPTSNSAPPPPQAPSSGHPGNFPQVMANRRNTPRTPLALSSDNYAQHGHSTSSSGAPSRLLSADASTLFSYGLYSSDSQVPHAPSLSRSLQGSGLRLPPMAATLVLWVDIMASIVMLTFSIILAVNYLQSVHLMPEACVPSVAAVRFRTASEPEPNPNRTPGANRFEPENFKGYLERIQR
ncbi:hypothetical protein B0H10DRAFT_1956365 [Mycena sp. CBHHK59/15]|nr:hypothetical protein B0H10DRAFT_1956365 [Mycena sp. CBHHK59/15]